MRILAADLATFIMNIWTISKWSGNVIQPFQSRVDFHVHFDVILAKK
jgi:hypothetical protein